LYESVLVDFDVSHQAVEKMAGAERLKSPTLGLEFDALVVSHCPQVIEMAGVGRLELPALGLESCINQGISLTLRHGWQP
jgi:hypothetical protein